MDYSSGLLMGDPALTGLLGGGPPQPDMPGVQQTPSAPPVQAPAPQAAQLPQPSIDPATAQSLLAQMPQENPRKSLLARVHDAFVSGLVGAGDGPTGYEGTLSPDEIAAAKPGFMDMLHAPEGVSGHDLYQQRLLQALKTKGDIAQFQQAQAIQAGRAKIYKEIGMPPTTDAEAMRAWVGQAMPRLMAIGDYQGVQALSPYADRLNTVPRRDPGTLFKNDKTGEVQAFDTSAGSSIPPGWSKLAADQQGSYDFFVDKNGQGEYVKKGDNAAAAKQIALGRRVLSNENVTISQQGAADRAELGNVNKQVNSFNTLNAPLTKAATFYPGFDAAAKEALAGNPAAFKSITAQMAAQLDPALQLRLGTLMYAQNIDPSWKGTLDRFFSEKTQGRLPPDQLRKVIQVVQQVRKEQRALYTSRYNDLVANNPGAERYAHSADYIFGPEQAAGSGAPDINDVEGYLKALRSKKK